mgnify:CR=1 FL=1
MNILRKYIRQILLTEAAKGLKDLEAEDLYIYINNWGDGFAIELGDEESPSVTGTINVFKDDRHGPCGDAYMVGSSDATHGWGPLLYDLAIEYATEVGAGLMPDRGSVSADAQGVWQYYMQNRGDVTAHQLDDPRNTLTPAEEDNCDQEVAGGFHYQYSRAEEPENPDWMKSPLSKRWTKSPTTLSALRAGDRLLED